MDLTSGHMLAARALLRWEQRTLAEKSGVSVPTIQRLEAMEGPVTANRPTINSLVGTFEAAGIEFQNGGSPGVRLVGKGR